MPTENESGKGQYPLHERLDELRADQQQKWRDYWQISRVDQRVANTEAEKDYWTRREGETWHDFEEAEARTGDFQRENKEKLAEEEEAMRKEEEARRDAENHQEAEKGL